MDTLAINGGTPVRTKRWAPWPYFAEDEVSAATEVLNSGKVNYWTGENHEVTGQAVRGKCGEFEQRFSEYINCKYSISVANGTLALELCLKALGIGSGEEVIVPSRTFIATASACVAQGAKPVFADIEVESQCISLSSIREKLTSKTKAIICVHLAGWACEMDEILKFAKENDLKVIEDCAQSLGGKYDGKMLGTFGDMSAFSFCQDKILTTGGEGGMVSTNDSELYLKAWEYKDHGKNFHFFNKSVGGELVDSSKAEEFGMYSSIGTNFRMTEMQAAIGIKQLEKLPLWIETRQKYAQMLHEGLSGIAGIKLYQPSEKIHHACYKFYAFIDTEFLSDDWTREKIVSAISAEGVVCQLGSTWAIGKESGWGRVLINGKREDIQLKECFPNDYRLGTTALMFQVHPTLDEESISDTIKAAKKVFSFALSHNNFS
ncbi:MAG: aminotransferase [Halobacteriovoraceae bacterium]|nr:aminotransferase [Halobacteriovoraceae bacterium]|tara:strand:- start:4934 stop:6232 length:1299 start_codon:yes stop_codon:yes gene_type:complete